MNLNEYREAAGATRNRRDTAIVGVNGFQRGSNNMRRLIEGSIGLSAEAGELLSEIKSYVFHGEILDHQRVRREAGDVLWYLDEILEACGLTLDEVIYENTRKLAAREATWQKEK